jgi:hypothetical protein
MGTASWRSSAAIAAARRACCVAVSVDLLLDAAADLVDGPAC